jgi:hypothetical protein
VALSVFDDPKAPPTDRALQHALGKAGPAWVSLKKKLCRECAPLEEEWAFAGAKYGWSLRLKRWKRVIVYMTPCTSHFLASFALGEKACAAALEEGLPARILALIAEAPRYAEGRGVRIPVRTEKETSGIPKLAAIKLAH